MFSSYRAGLWLPDEKPMYGARLIKDHPLAQGLVLDTLMNEYGGNIAFDGSGFQNHGTMHNCLWSPRGIDFNGSTSYIDAGNNPILNLQKAITIVAMLKTNKMGIQNIAAKREVANPGFIFRLSGSNYLNFLFYNGSSWITNVDDTNPITVGERTCVGVTYNKENVIFYKNGNSIKTIPETEDIASHLSQTLKIGVQGFFNYAFFEDIIEFIRIWNRDLQQPEISLLHENPYCMYEYPILEQGMLYYPTIINQFQRANIGADLYDGVLIT